MNAVLDACAMIAYLRGEAGGSVVDAILCNPAATCYVHSVNLCEVYYHFLRTSDQATAGSAIDDLFSVGLIERCDLQRPFWQRVAENKARGKISLADCFCLALAQDVGGQVVTSDHHEFDPIVPLGICTILFIR